MSYSKTPNDDIFEIFVSMPYGRDENSKKFWNRFYQFGILGMKPYFKQYKLNFLRAQETPSALILKQSVISLINRCHICLGIITDLNPNVLWEVGFAESKDKPIILLVAEGVNAANYSPVLIAEALKVTYDGTIFDDETPDDARLTDFQQKLLSFFNIGVNVVKGVGKPAPQYSVFSNRFDANLPTAVLNAENTIDLITTNLSYYADFDNFTAELNGQQCYAFDSPINKGVRVRILTLNPESVISEYRAKQLGREHEVNVYRDQLRRAATSFYHRYIDKENVEIKIYDDLPSQITLLIDGNTITSFVSRGQQARYNIHVEFNQECKGVHETFENHFAEVYANQKYTTDISHFKWAHRIPKAIS